MSKRRNRKPWYKRIPMKYQIAASVVFVFLIGLLVYREATKNSWIQFQDNGFTEAERAIVTDAMQDWATLYGGCPVTVEIHTSQEMPVNDEGNYVEADAVGREVTYYVNRIRESKPLRQRPLRELVLHETTHTCRPPISQSDTQFFEQNTWMLTDGHRVIGFEGLSIVVQRNDGTLTYYNTCEEGLAEWGASNVEHDYESYHPGYANLGRWFFQEYGSTNQSIRPMELSKANDFRSFTRDVLNLSPTTEIQLTHLQMVVDHCYGLFIQPNPDFPTSP